MKIPVRKIKVQWLRRLVIAVLMPILFLLNSATAICRLPVSMYKFSRENSYLSVIALLLLLPFVLPRAIMVCNEDLFRSVRWFWFRSDPAPWAIDKESL